MWLVLAASLFAAWTAFAQGEPATVKISSQLLHDGRASSLLYGNFIELLDDLVPGMRAEMLNNRGFEGLTRSANWAYYDGSLNICDRDWKKNHAEEDLSNPFNGTRSMKLSSAEVRGASITQDGLGVAFNKEYHFTGYFRASITNDLEATAIIKTKLPTGEWMELGRCRVSGISLKWKKLSGDIRSIGTTDRAVFELRMTGNGDVWVDQLSLMPADNSLGWRFDVFEAIRETHPDVLRWGGSICDPGGYKWKDGIGDRDQRTPFPNKVWGRNDPNEAGIDEFCQLCRLVGARPMICVSFADGPQSAAELVQYCNDPITTPLGAKRAANGFQKPYNIKYVQVGNEISGDDENYLRQFSEFSQGIKKADSKVQVLSSFPTQKLLTAAGKDIDFICPHQYTTDFAACENEFAKLGEMIRGTPGCSQIKIAVTEWNTSAGDWGLARGKFLTLENALLNARYLNLLLRHSDLVEMAFRSNLANSLGSGIFETSNLGVLRRPSFYVMKLYLEHSANKKMVLKLDNAPANVDMAAIMLWTKKFVSVFAVNTKNEPVAIKLDLSEFGTTLHAASAETVCDTLDARQPDVMNHWTSTNRVSTLPLKVEDNKIILPALSASVIECKE